MGIVSMIAFGYDLNSIEQHSPIVDHLLVYMPTIHKRVNSIVPHWRLFSMESDKKFYKAENPIKELVDSMIKIPMILMTVKQRDIKIVLLLKPCSMLGNHQ